MPGDRGPGSRDYRCEGSEAGARSVWLEPGGRECGQEAMGGLLPIRCEHVGTDPSEAGDRGRF